MELSIFWMERSFKYFNDLIFEGKLETPHFKIIKSSKTNGKCQCCIKKGVFFAFGERDYTIALSNYYNRTQKEFENTLIHEMIHLEFQQKGMLKEGHGKNWKRRAYEIGKKYGYDIQQYNEPTSQERMVADNTMTANYILVFRSCKYGTRCFMRISPKHLARFVNLFDRNSKTIKFNDNYIAFDIEWYITTNKVFTIYKKSVKLANIVHVTDEEWENLYSPNITKVDIDEELKKLYI